MSELIEAIPAIALGVYAHPDDADVGCGGTLARWARGGCAVHLIVCTDGGKGTKDPAVKPEHLAEERADELAQACKLIGVTSHTQLGHPDGALEDDSDFRQELVTHIRRIRPDVVCGHDPTAVFFGQDYFNHRDHRIAGWVLLDALSPASALPHYFPDAGPPHQVTTAYLSGSLEPDVWVDISDTVEVKAEAVECHRTQFADSDGWAGEAVRQRAEEEGRRAGVRHAEGFRRLRLGG